MQITAAEREFNYNGVKLPDPNPTFNVDQVKNFYCVMYPELASSVAEGPTNRGNKLVYTFQRSVGTKG